MSMPDDLGESMANRPLTAHEDSLVTSQLINDRELIYLGKLGTSPETIETLLCEAECRLPDELTTPYLAAAYDAVRQAEGSDAAESWTDRLQRRIRDHHHELDAKVEAYYGRYPDALRQIPERFWGTDVPARNPYGYTPEYRPEEQGLPYLEDELMRLDLIPDIRRDVKMAYLFDIDGPITDPSQKRVIYPGLMDRIAIALLRDEPVALNTGRATGWVLEKVLPPLKDSLGYVIGLMDLQGHPEDALSLFCIIGEKGGEWVTFGKDGEPRHGLSQQLKTPEKVRVQIEELVKDTYADAMFMDPLKRTMTSVEMHDGYDRQKFTASQRELKEEVQAILEASGLNGDFRVLATPIATDIESVHVGKALGAQRICQWLRACRIRPERFLTFGDDESDMDMARQLVMTGHEAKFVNVGQQALFSHEFTVILSPGDSLGSWRVMDRAHEYGQPVPWPPSF